MAVAAFGKDTSASDYLITASYVMASNSVVIKVSIPATKDSIYVTEVPAINYKPVGNGFCVVFVRTYGYGFESYSGDAITWKRYINSETPKVGSVVVLQEGPLGHLAIITAVYENSFSVVEQNFSGRYTVNRRTLSNDYNKILGFIIGK